MTPDPQSHDYISDKFHLPTDKVHHRTPTLEYNKGFHLMESELRRPNGYDKVRATCQHTVVVHQNKLFVFGGKTVNTVGAVKATAEIAIFSLDEDRWLVEQNVGYIREEPQPRWGHSAVLLDHRMVIYGGMNQRSRDPLQSSVLGFFNLETCLWEDVTKYRIQGGVNNTDNCGGRMYHSAVVLPERVDAIDQSLVSRMSPVMLIFGGLKGTGEIKRCNDLWAMERLESDMDGFRWLHINTAGRTPPRMVGQKTALLPATKNSSNHDLMIIYGGNPCLSHGVFILDCNTWTWGIRVTIDSPMCPMMLFSHSIAIHNHYLISVGGYGSTGHPTLLALNLNTGKYVAQTDTSVSIGSRIDSAVYIDQTNDQLYVINGLSTTWNALRNDMAIIDLPIMEWSPKTHLQFPSDFRKAVFVILLMANIDGQSISKKSKKINDDVEDDEDDDEDEDERNHQVLGNTTNDTSSDNESLTDSEVDEELQLITSISQKNNRKAGKTNPNNTEHVINMRNTSSSSSTASLSSLIIEPLGVPEFLWWELPEEVIHRIILHLSYGYTIDFSDVDFNPELEPFDD